MRSRCVPAHDEDDPKYAAIGKDLIDRGLAQITERGLLIYNPFDELTEVYDVQPFPEYYYESTLASAEVSYNGRTELLLLPGEELAIQKALTRVGTTVRQRLRNQVLSQQRDDDAWEERIEGIIHSEGLYEANKMLRSLDTGDMDWGKLTAAVELADVQKASNIAFVAEHLGEFTFLPGANNEADAAHFLVDNVDEYGTNIDMEEYFDFSGFGEYFAEEHDGQFSNGGFVYFDSNRTLADFPKELESEVVADVDTAEDFDLTFYLDYCPYAEEGGELGDTRRDAAGYYSRHVHPESVDKTIDKMESRWYDATHRQTEAEKMVEDYNNGLTVLNDTSLACVDTGFGMTM